MAFRFRRIWVASAITFALLPDFQTGWVRERGSSVDVGRYASRKRGINPCGWLHPRGLCR